MKLQTVSGFVMGLAHFQREMLESLDIQPIERIRFSFSYPIQIAGLSLLKSITGHSPWWKLRLPYGIKCLYNASNGIRGSIDSIVFRKECFMLDFYTPQKGETIVDVGAYIGLYSILSSRLMGNKGHLYAIEPEPTTFSLLKRNLILNNLFNIVAVNSSLSNHLGIASLFVPKESTAGSSFYLPHLQAQKIEDYAMVKVRMRTFDSLLKSLDLRNIDIVKIDVEGAELSVLQGARFSISKGAISKFVIEIHKTVNKVDDIANFLKSYDYIVDDCFDINEQVAMLYARKSRH